MLNRYHTIILFGCVMLSATFEMTSSVSAEMDSFIKKRGEFSNNSPSSAFKGPQTTTNSQKQVEIPNQVKNESINKASQNKLSPQYTNKLRGEKVLVAIIDSGTDLNHSSLTSITWTNPNEIPANQQDDDDNGYVDDLHGWNFLGGDNQLINLEHRDVVSDNVVRLSEISEKNRLNRATAEEKAWFSNKMKDGILKAKYILAGPYSHGTHVADVAGRDLPGLQLMPIRLIHVGLSVSSLSRAIPQKDEELTVLRNYLKNGFAEDYGKKFARITNYVKKNKVDIANGSYGMSYSTLQRITQHFYFEIYKEKPNEQEIKTITQFLSVQLANKCNKIISGSPQTLFVYAAGNDHSNNDQFPTFPTNAMADNEISVAATYTDILLAPFSNYGKITVDVAAPGVFIKAAVPGGKEMYMSGTSMAAPYVTNIAAKIKAANYNLTPIQIKKIIMETVDKKAFLQGKIKSEGIVNMERAVKAAEYSINNDLDPAIALARKNVISKLTKGKPTELTSLNSVELVQMPSMVDLKSIQ